MEAYKNRNQKITFFEAQKITFFEVQKSSIMDTGWKLLG